MKNHRVKIYVRNGKSGLDIYLDVSGKSHYLTTRRPNGLIYLWLKNGKTISELTRLKPRYNRIDQKRYYHAQHLMKMAKDYLVHNLEK